MAPGGPAVDGEGTAWALAAVAGLLRQGSAVHHAALGLAVGGLLARPVGWLAAALVAAVALETAFAVRVGLDAELFARAAAADDPPDPAPLDLGLARAGLRRAEGPPRSWAERSLGARALFRDQGLAAGVVACLALAAWAWA